MIAVIQTHKKSRITVHKLEQICKYNNLPDPDLPIITLSSHLTVFKLKLIPVVKIIALMLPRHQMK